MDSKRELLMMMIVSLHWFISLELIEIRLGECAKHVRGAVHKSCSPEGDVKNDGFRPGQAVLDCWPAIFREGGNKSEASFREGGNEMQNQLSRLDRQKRLKPISNQIPLRIKTVSLLPCRMGRFLFLRARRSPPNTGEGPQSMVM